MRKTHFLVLLIITLGLIVSACKMDASTAPTDTPSEIDNLFSQLTAAPTYPLTPTDSEGTGGGEFDAIETAEARGATQAAPSGVITMTPTVQPISPTAQPLVVPGSYSLKKGEWPYCIARRFNINPETLMNANNITPDMVFSEGYNLIIPQNAPPYGGDRALLSHPDSYTVKSNDTFYSIACIYGDVYPEAIANKNGRSVNDTLSPGTVLQIP